MFCLKSPGISAYLYSKFVCIFAIEKRSTGCEGVPFTIRAIVADFEELSHAGKSSTRTSVKDEHLKMEFFDGDSIGVFAIKDGAIMDDIDNWFTIGQAAVGIRWEMVHFIGMME